MNRLILSAVLVVTAGCGGLIPKCDTKQFGGAFCIPDSGVAAAGQSLTFEVIDQCNGGCGKSTLACEVKRDAGTITLAVSGQVCEAAEGIACKAACALTPHSCVIPALEEGDYTVISPGHAAQALQVRDGGSGTCKATAF